MSMNHSLIHKGILSLVLTFAALAGWAQQQQNQQNEQQQQQQDPPQRATIDSIDVIRDYRPILADAVKIRRSPDMTNKREYQPKLEYSIIDKKLDITTGTRRLDIQEMPFVDLSRKTSNYIKLGAGNYSTYLGEVYLTNDEYLDTRFGMYAKHLSQKGEWADQVYGQQEVRAFGRQVYDAFTLSGNVGYKRYATRFYGKTVFSDALVQAGKGGLTGDADKQAFNDIFLDSELSSNARAAEPEALSYSVKLNAFHFSDAFDAKESAFALGAYLDKQVNHFHIGVRASGDFGQVQGQNTKVSNHLIKANPYVRFKGENYDLIVGALIASELGDSTRVNIFPSASLDFALIPNYAHLYVGVDGDVEKTTLRALAGENPWLAPDVHIANTMDRLRIYGGVKGNAGATFGYKVGISYRQIENMQFFQPILTEPYRYEVMYESGTKGSSVFGFEAEANLRVSETVSLGGRLNFNEFDLQVEEEAWFQPKLQVAANTRVNISDRLYLDGEILFMGQTYTRAIPVEAWDFIGMPAIEKRVIPAFADLNAGLEFRATDQIGIYVRANNLLGTKYERYLHYPRLGLNVIGGVNFTF